MMNETEEALLLKVREKWTKRILSKERFSLVYPGVPAGKGTYFGTFSEEELKSFARRNIRPSTVYWKNLRIAARLAAVEQGWKFGPDEAIYIVITAYVDPNNFTGNKKTKFSEKERKKLFRNNVNTPCAVRRNPSNLGHFIKNVEGALNGIIFGNTGQVISIQLVKMFGEPRVEIFAGKANNFGELQHDIRNV